jgi:type VI secretion system protein ImpH
VTATNELSVEERLIEEPYAFDFFQAVALLRAIAGDAVGPLPAPGTVRFAGHPSLTFPASAIHDLAVRADHPPRMTVTFLGLTGPSGVLPRHYTEMLLRIERDVRGPEKRALRDWLDLFNHRVTALFYAAWEKYRFRLAYARGEADRDPPDPFTQALLSLIGLGTPGLRNRLTVPAADTHARVDDLGLLPFSGLLAARHRSAWGLEVLLGAYFLVPVAVEQFRGQWLLLDELSQTRLGTEGGNGTLGTDAVAGDRVWDIQGKFRVRLGPLRYIQFLSLLPDPADGRSAFALLAELVRLYAGPEFDFDVQLVLAAEHVPACALDDHTAGPRLGWSCWLLSAPLGTEADDPVFDGPASQ